MIGHKPIFNPFLTVNETIQMFIDSYNFTYYVDHCRYKYTVDDYLEKFNLMDIKDKYVGDDLNKSLSTGQLVQLSILLNTMEQPDMLILDEPLANLDIKTSVHIIKVLKSLGIPVIITLHHPNNIILEYISRLIILDAGRLISNQSLVEIDDKLKFYENLIMNENEPVLEISSGGEQTKLDIVCYKSYIADVRLSRQVWNAVYNIVLYGCRNTTFMISAVLSFIPLVLVYLFLNGTDFSDEINGYYYMSNIMLSFLTGSSSVFTISLFQLELLFPLIKFYGNIRIFNPRLFIFIYMLVQFTLVGLYALIYGIIISLLHKNNLVILGDILYVNIYCWFNISYTFYSLMYIFENVNISFALWVIYGFFMTLNSGMLSSQYPSIMNYSMFYYLLNIISVKAQELYNYPLLTNGEFVYTIYGYTADISHYYYYLLGFFILPTLIWFYPKQNKIFLT